MPFWKKVLFFLLFGLPPTVGFFMLLGSVGALELEMIPLGRFWAQTGIGFGLILLSIWFRCQMDK